MLASSVAYLTTAAIISEQSSSGVTTAYLMYVECENSVVVAAGA